MLTDEDRISAAVFELLISPRAYRRKRRQGFVYFVQCSMSGNMKIGYSQNLSQRFRKLEMSSPTPLKLLASFPADREVEPMLHEEFKDDRLHGEWFKSSERMLAMMADFVRYSQEKKKT